MNQNQSFIYRYIMYICVYVETTCRTYHKSSFAHNSKRNQSAAPLPLSRTFPMSACVFFLFFFFSLRLRSILMPMVFFPIHQHNANTHFILKTSFDFFCSSRTKPFYRILLNACRLGTLIKNATFFLPF